MMADINFIRRTTGKLPKNSADYVVGSFYWLDKTGVDELYFCYDRGKVLRLDNTLDSASINKIIREYLNNNGVDLSGYLKEDDIADWAKSATKPTYTANEVGALPVGTSIPTKMSELEQDVDFVDASDFEGLATEEWVEGKGYITEHQSLAGFATESYVDEKINDLIDGAPEALDTLKEIADWIGSDETGTAELISKVAQNESDISELKSKKYVWKRI